MGHPNEVDRPRGCSRSGLISIDATMRGTGNRPPLALGGDMEPNDKMQSLVFSLVSPEKVFRKQTVKRIVSEFMKRYGSDVLIDFLVAVDSTDLLASVVVLDRGEVDEYMFQKYGLFDDDMMVKVQMTDRWEQFLRDAVEMSGQATEEAITEIAKNEGFGETT